MKLLNCIRYPYQTKQWERPSQEIPIKRFVFFYRFNSSPSGDGEFHSTCPYSLSCFTIITQDVMAVYL